MPKRETAAAASQSSRHTAKSKSAGRANLAKGHEANRERGRRAQEARERGEPTAGDRWAMLLDGRLTVAELSDKEIEKGRVRNIDGGFTGKGRKMPSHLFQQFMNERLKRERARIMDMQKVATETAKTLLLDDETPASVKAKLIALLWDRNLGRNPETVKVDVETGFAAMLREVLIDRGDLDAELADFDK